MSPTCCSYTACSRLLGDNPRHRCCSGCTEDHLCSWGRCTDPFPHHRHVPVPRTARKLCSRDGRTGNILAGTRRRLFLQRQACMDTGPSCRRTACSQSRLCCSDRVRIHQATPGSSTQACSDHRCGPQRWVCRDTAQCFHRTRDSGIREGHSHTICSHPNAERSHSVLQGRNRRGYQTPRDDRYSCP